MKKLTAIILAGIMMLAGQALVVASDDKSEGYRSKFYGTVEEMPEGYTGTWIVNGRQVEVTSRTKIEQEYGKAAVGSYVEIKGRSDGQTFTAYELEVKKGRGDSESRSHYEHSESDEFYGTITTMPHGMLGTWVIDAREVYVNERTRIEEEDGPAKVGARVEVKGSYQKETFIARKIEVKR
jgi:hypothetical protein